MSHPEPGKAESERHGSSGQLPRQPNDGAQESVDVAGNVRSRLMSTTLMAAATVVFLAASGAVAASEAWLLPMQASAIVAAGSVLVSLSALIRAYFLCRSIQPVRVATGDAPIGSAHSGLEAVAEELPAERTVGLPPAVSPWKGTAEKGSFNKGTADFDPFGSQDAPEFRHEVFGMLAYRLQSLVNRLIHQIDHVEQEIEDPELLKSLYSIDHLATRIRRQIENLAVLGGEGPQRRSDVPVEVNAVLRAAIAEIEHYTQVTAVPIQNAKMHGHVVAETIHLLAELLENATTFTTPGAPKVMLRAHRVTAGLAIQVQDRGIGMSMPDITRINRLLNGSTRVDVAQLLQDGRIGLAVVEILARRHNIGAEVQPNIFGGTDASIVIPHELLADEPLEEPEQANALPPYAAHGTTARHAAPGGAAGIRAPSPPFAPAPTPQPAPLPGPSPAAAQFSQRAGGSAGSPVDTSPWYRSPMQSDPTTQVAAQHEPHPLADRPSVQAVPNAIPVVPPLANPSSADDLFHRGSADVQHTDEQPPAGLPVRRRGESYANLRAGMDSATSADFGAGSVPDAAPRSDLAASLGANRAEQAVHSSYDDHPHVDRSVRPALPQRRGSYMREELREQPDQARPVPGHDPTLMALLLEGRAHGRSEQVPSDGRKADAHQPHNVPSDSEGESVRWQT